MAHRATKPRYYGDANNPRTYLGDTLPALPIAQNEYPIKVGKTRPLLASINEHIGRERAKKIAELICY